MRKVAPAPSALATLTEPVLPEGKVVRYYQMENKIHAALAYEIGAKIPLVKAAK